MTKTKTISNRRRALLERRAQVLAGFARLIETDPAKAYKMLAGMSVDTLGIGVILGIALGVVGGLFIGWHAFR